MENTTALTVVAVATLMLVTVALSVVACEWRGRRRKAAEAAAMRRRLDAYLIAQKEKADRHIQSLSPEFQEKWEQAIKAGFI